MKKIVLTIFSLLILVSCEDSFEEQLNTSEGLQLSFNDLKFTPKDKLRENFARAFGKAIKESPELRGIIKEEALKMMNKDYDVLYQMIKDRPLNGNIMRSSEMSYNTVRALILSHFENEGDLIEIESQLPLLTIFVPKLPENSFSAETWDTEDENQLPVVAIRLDNHNEVPMIDLINDYEYVLEPDLIPGYPVIVIKNNERLVVNQGENHNYRKSTRLIQTSDNMSFRFIDDNFDPVITPISPVEPLPGDPTDPIYGGGGSNLLIGGGANSEGVSDNGVSCNNPNFIPGRQNNVAQFLKDARNAFENSGITAPWQRDNIYYQLTPQETTNDWVGGRYVESISYFRLQGTNPTAVFELLANQHAASDPDPQSINHGFDRNPNKVPWTDGSFEIGISLIDNAKQRATINAQGSFPASAEQLFTFTQQTVTRRRGCCGFFWNRTYWKPVITGYKGIDFNNACATCETLEFHEWDLLEYSNRWTYEFKELDYDVDITEGRSQTRKYNTNFQLTVPIKKVGLQFGGSIEDTDNTTRSYKWKAGDDFLGQFDVGFGHAVLNKHPCNDLLYPRLYRITHVQVEIRPVQKEF